MRQSATTLASELLPAELHALLGLLEQSRLRGPHLEIGTAAGGTLKELMRAYPDSARPQFVVVDPMEYFPDQQIVVGRNLSSAGIDAKTVDFRVTTSWRALQDALRRRERFSFILIDADHNADRVMQDLRWTRHLEAGGYVCLHDHSACFPGVGWATDRFLRRNQGYRKVALIETLAILLKEKDATRAEVGTFDLALAAAVRPLQRLWVSLEKRQRALAVK